MFDDLRRNWRAFRADPPGQRFRCRYLRRRERSGALHKALLLAAGVALIALGIVLLVLPGPGLLLIAVGAGLLGEESLVAARLLDHVDRFISRCVERWRRA